MTQSGYSCSAEIEIKNKLLRQERDESTAEGGQSYGRFSMLRRPRVRSLQFGASSRPEQAQYTASVLFFGCKFSAVRMVCRICLGREVLRVHPVLKIGLDRHTS